MGALLLPWPLQLCLPVWSLRSLRRRRLLESVYIRRLGIYPLTRQPFGLSRGHEVGLFGLVFVSDNLSAASERAPHEQECQAGHPCIVSSGKEAAADRWQR